MRLAAVFALLFLATASAAQPPVGDLKRVPGLGGWHVQNGKPEVWKLEGDVIAVTGPGGGYLTTDRQYGDFEMSLEYRLPAGANSGIGVRYPPGAHPSSKGIELQLLDDNDPKFANLQPAQYNGSIYKLVPPRARAARPPGEWNRLLIRCTGPRILVKLNGVVIQDVSVDQETRSPGADLTALSERPRRGHLGLQSHGDPAEFRNVVIKADGASE